MKITVSRTARVEIEQFVRRISEDDPVAAERFRAQVMERIRQLAQGNYQGRESVLKSGNKLKV